MLVSSGACSVPLRVGLGPAGRLLSNKVGTFPMWCLSLGSFLVVHVIGDLWAFPHSQFHAVLPFQWGETEQWFLSVLVWGVTASDPPWSGILEGPRQSMQVHGSTQHLFLMGVCLFKYMWKTILGVILRNTVHVL